MLFPGTGVWNCENTWFREEIAASETILRKYLACVSIGRTGSPPGSSLNPQNTKRWVSSSTFAQMRSLRLSVALAVTVTPVAVAGTPWGSSG